MWGEQEVVRDIVRVIRLFRPLVIYSVFSGTPADGHGHHQLAGKLVPMAFRAAADPARYPGQIMEGLRPWQAIKLYRGTGFGAFGAGQEATTLIEGGPVDPLLGRSYAEITAEGRSQNKTQAQRTPEIRGPLASGLVLLDSKGAINPSETSAFDGIDVSLPGVAALAGLPEGDLKQEISVMDQTVNRALSEYNVLAPEKSVPALAAVLSAIRDARQAGQALADATPSQKAETDFILAAKERDPIIALQGAAGIAVDALADTETVAAGESFPSTMRVFLSHPDLVKVTG